MIFAVPLNFLKISLFFEVGQPANELHIENNQLYLHPRRPNSPANNFFHAQQIFNGIIGVLLNIIYKKSLFTLNSKRKYTLLDLSSTQRVADLRLVPTSFGFQGLISFEYW